VSILGTGPERVKTYYLGTQVGRGITRSYKTFVIPSLHNNVVQLSIFLQRSTKRHVSAPRGPSSGL